MTNLERIHYLIRCGEADNAGTWARRMASDAFSSNYSLRVYSFDSVKCTVSGKGFEAFIIG